jgi:hypothetical protein
VDLTWRTGAIRHEGSYAIRATFLEPWAGVRAQGPAISLTPYASLSLALYPQQHGEYFFELFDTNGNSMGRQPLAWYAPEGRLTPYAWNILTIPLDHLMPPETPTRAVTGFAVTAPEVGSIFLDAIKLEKFVTNYPRFEEASSTEVSPTESPE